MLISDVAVFNTSPRAGDVVKHLHKISTIVDFRTCFRRLDAVADGSAVCAGLPGRACVSLAGAAKCRVRRGRAAPVRRRGSARR